MTSRDGHERDLRSDRFLRFVLIALFAAWSLASVLHAPAFAALPDGTPFIALHQLDGGSTDQDQPRGQACSAPAHCSGISLVPIGSLGVPERLARKLPRAVDVPSLASVARLDRPPILSFCA
jgi:hypothetical protein